MAVGVMLVATGCSKPFVPAHPFDHDLKGESSVAVPVPDRGDVALVVSTLEDAGFFCAQVRANDVAAQIWCRASVAPVDDEIESSVTVVNMVSSRAGAIQYADISARGSGSQSDWDRLSDVLNESFLAVWPSDSSKVQVVIAGLERGPGFFPDDPHPPRTKTFSTKNAGYLIAEGGLVPKFRLITSAVQDYSWPYDASDYATTMTAAGPDLAEAGYECFPNWTSPCRRGVEQGSNQEIRYTTPNPNVSLDNPDQILSLEMLNPGTRRDADRESLPSLGFPRGLPFLVSAARAPVEAQIVQTQRTGESFIGIIAGTILIVEAPHNKPKIRSGPLPVNVTIGVPPIRIVQ